MRWVDAKRELPRAWWQALMDKHRGNTKQVAFEADVDIATVNRMVCRYGIRRNRTPSVAEPIAQHAN